MAGLIKRVAGSNIPLLIGVPLALVAGGWVELALLAGVSLSLWLWCGVIGWKRPTRQGLAGLTRVTMLTAVLSLVHRYPAIEQHGAIEAVRIGGALVALAWAARMWLLSCAAAELIELSLVPRLSGILALSSILGGSLLFLLELRHAGGVMGPHTPLQSAHLWWAYTGGVVLTLVVPIALLALTAVYIMVRDDPARPKLRNGPDSRRGCAS